MSVSASAAEPPPPFNQPKRLPGALVLLDQFMRDLAQPKILSKAGLSPIAAVINMP